VAVVKRVSHYAAYLKPEADIEFSFCIKVESCRTITRNNYQDKLQAPQLAQLRLCIFTGVS